MKYITVFLAFTAAAFISSAAAQCTGQGAGNCNIVYRCWSEVGADNTDCSLELYSHTCDVIGGTWLDPNQGDILDSQLPYTIIIDYLEDSYTSNIQISFNYAAGKYGTGITNCSEHKCNTGITACEYAVCSFPCEA